MTRREFLKTLGKSICSAPFIIVAGILGGLEKFTSKEAPKK